MSKTLYFQFILCLLASTGSVAQHLTSYRDAGRTGLNLTDHMLLLDSRKVLYGDGSAEETKGTPYLAETFDSANVYTIKGVFTAVPMRYNVHEDYFEFKNKDVTYILDPALNIKRVDFRDYSFVVEKSEAGGKMKLGFFVLLDSGKVTLVAKKIVSYREPQPVKAMEEAKPGRYTKKDDEYFIRIEKGQLTEISSIKKMIESFPEKQNELKAFVDREKISKKEEDLIKLVQYYNSI
jgi:hypothetical protein